MDSFLAVSGDFFQETFLPVDSSTAAIFWQFRATWVTQIGLFQVLGNSKSACCQHGFVASGADGIKLNFGNYFVLLFWLTKTNWTFVSNSTSVIYIGGRSGNSFSNAPPDHKPFSLAASRFLSSLRQFSTLSGDKKLVHRRDFSCSQTVFQDFRATFF